jgi:AbiV family abortive infection protein
VRLFEHGEFGTSVLLAMLAREELGRSLILRDLAQEVDKGVQLTPAAVSKRCEDHVTKQRAGASTIVLRVEPATQIGEAARALMQSKPGSVEWKHARSVIDSARNAKTKRTALDRHVKRTGALYVDLDANGAHWSRPWVIDPAVARDELDDAVADYAYECDHLRDEVINDDFPGMANARARMEPKPNLPLAIWPPIA